MPSKTFRVGHKQRVGPDREGYGQIEGLTYHQSILLREVRDRPYGYYVSGTVQPEAGALERRGLVTIQREANAYSRMKGEHMRTIRITAKGRRLLKIGIRL